PMFLKHSGFTQEVTIISWLSTKRILILHPSISKLEQGLRPDLCSVWWCKIIWKPEFLL
uniref:Uncharacterized protein n=1 Tax=Aegilops tauschii subsp. strangulata TaxID=200361 RepID=A0A453C4E0_AEGTS